MRELESLVPRVFHIGGQMLVPGKTVQVSDEVANSGPIQQLVEAKQIGFVKAKASASQDDERPANPNPQGKPPPNPQKG